MPQPLNRVTANPGSMEFSNISLSKRPELAAQAMDVVAIWSRIDAYIEYIFANAIDTKSVYATKILHSIDSLTIRTAVIKTVIEESVSAEACDLFDKIIKSGNGSKKARNSFSHHIWGYSENLPNALLLMDAKYFVEYAAGVSEDLEYWLTLSGPENAGNRSDFSIRSRDLSKIFVYRKNDFEAYIKEANRIYAAITFFRQVLPSFGGYPVDTIRDKIFKTILV